MSQNSDELQYILIERGSFFTHCGYAGNDKVELSFRTPKISVEAQFKYIFEEVLGVNPVKYNIVIIKDTGTSQQVLKDEASLLFTKFNINACAFVNAQLGVIQSWVNKGLNGVIIDIGYEKTLIVPFVEFLPQMDFMKEIPMAGRAIEQFIINQLLEQGNTKDIIENNRETLFPYLMKDYFYFDTESEYDFEKEEIENRKKTIPKKLTFQVKDGKSIEIPLPRPNLPHDIILEDFKSQDLTFSKEIINQIIKILETFGKDIYGSVVEYDSDPYTSWWVGRIIISGRASNLLGLRSLLIRELLKIPEFKRYTECERKPSCPLVDVEFKNVAFTIRNAPPEDPPDTWLGGSIESSLKAFKEVFISHETYKNNPDIIFELDHEEMWKALLK